MRKSNGDPLETFFNDEARSILYSLVYRSDPAGLASGEDHVFEPTISAVFEVFSALMEGSTPDLYAWEWYIISEAWASQSKSRCRLPASIRDARNQLVVLVEDVVSKDKNTSSFELSKKLAGLNALQMYAVCWHAQKQCVAKARGEHYEFPDIPFKG